MDQGMHRRGGELVNQHGILMMGERFQLRFQAVGEKQGFVVEIDFIMHAMKFEGSRPITPKTGISWWILLYLCRMTNEKAVAEKLLQVNAIRLNPAQPFTWASGWKSPIYCDNRRVLSFPYVRDFIKSELCNVLFEQFPDAGMLAGVATAGIAWGAMAADQLKLPYIYVRPKPKEHGLGNQIEGYYEKGQKVVVVEDLISTGKSSLQVVDVLREAGLEVVGMVAIFTYGFPVADEAFQSYGVKCCTLTNFPVLIELAIEKKIVSPEQEEVVLRWRKDPASWSP